MNDLPASFNGSERMVVIRKRAQMSVHFRAVLNEGETEVTASVECLALTSIQWQSLIGDVNERL